MALLCLPNEIIHKICIYASSDPRRLPARPSGDRTDFFAHLRDLSSLSQVSRRVCDVARPVLYSSLHFDGKRLLPLLLFVRTIVKNPDLARHVNDMSLGLCTAIDQSHTATTREIMCEIDACLARAWFPHDDALQICEDQDGRSSLKRDTRRHGFTVNVCLSLVTNISQLALTTTSYRKYGKYMLPSANLDSLRDLNFAGDEAKGFKLYQVRDLCDRAPNLDKLSLHSCIGTASCLPIKILTSLKLENSLLAKGDLAKLTECCTKLTSFTYYSSNLWSMYETLERAEPLLSPRDIVEELAPCKSTLENLDVLFSGWAVQIYLRHHNVLITSMKEFTALKTLRLNEICLYCELTDNKRIVSVIEDLLPSSIEVVVLDQIRPQSSQVVEKLERQARSLPNLKEFTIHKSAELDWWMQYGQAHAAPR